MAEITIANVRDLPPPSEWPEWRVWVGRAAPRWKLKASGLANPFKVGQYPTQINMHTMTLEDVLYWYRVWLLRSASGAKMMDMSWLRSLLRKHGRLELVCCCITWDGRGDAPRKCHAEAIRDVLLEAKP